MRRELAVSMDPFDGCVSELTEGDNSLIPFASWTTQDCISAITDGHDAVSLKTAETITVDGKLVQRQ